MSLPFPGADRTCVVTGASQGIGAEIARQLVGRGHHVTLVARSSGKLEALAAEITDKGGRAAVLTADLADRPARAALLDRVTALGLTADVLVNNAGFSTLGPAFVPSYTQSLAGELRGSGVTATTLCPGPVDTGFGERAGFAREDAEKALPKMMWVSAEEVAKVGVEAMDKGRLVAIPGAANRVAAALAQVTPRSLLLPTLAKAHPGLR